MKTEQPEWKFIANIGDADPLEHGGVFIYEDKTGVYDPEVVILQPNKKDEEVFSWDIFRFSLERMEIRGDYLVYYRLPKGCDAPQFQEWWADKLESVSESIGISYEDLIAALCSKDTAVLAQAYMAIAEYPGCYEFDSCPIRIRFEDEIKEFFTLGELEVKT